jgi:hypothetical protein
VQAVGLTRLAARVRFYLSPIFSSHSPLFHSGTGIKDIEGSMRATLRAASTSVRKRTLDRGKVEKDICARRHAAAILARNSRSAARRASSVAVSGVGSSGSVSCRRAAETAGL